MISLLLTRNFFIFIQNKENVLSNVLSKPQKWDNNVSLEFCETLEKAQNEKLGYIKTILLHKLFVSITGSWCFALGDIEQSPCQKIKFATFSEVFGKKCKHLHFVHLSSIVKHHNSHKRKFLCLIKMKFQQLVFQKFD